MQSQVFELLDRYVNSNVRIETQETRDRIRNAVLKYERWLDRDVVLEDFDDDLVSAFLIASREYYAPATVNTLRTRLCGFWDWLARKKHVAFFPTVQPMRVPRPENPAWTPEQLSTLFESLAKLRGTVCGINAADWWLSLHYVALDAAERVSALFSVRWDWINRHDDGTATISIPASYRKGKSKRGVYYLREHVVDSVYRMDEVDDLVWPMDCHIGTFYRRYEKMLKSAGLPGGSKRKMHCMRRTHATLLDAAGQDASRSLMHSNRSTTECYIDRSVSGPDRFADHLPKVEVERWGSQRSRPPR